VTIREEDKGDRRLISCCIIDGRIVFFFFKNKSESGFENRQPWGDVRNNDPLISDDDISTSSVLV
jgi:hypothetical protein